MATCTTTTSSMTSLTSTKEYVTEENIFVRLAHRDGRRATKMTSETPKMVNEEEEAFAVMNYELYRRIPLSARVLLAATNAFYWLLAWRLARATNLELPRCAHDLCRSHGFHAVLVLTIASASSYYHFIQLGLHHEARKVREKAACACFKFTGFSLNGGGKRKSLVKCDGDDDGRVGGHRRSPSMALKVASLTNLSGADGLNDAQRAHVESSAAAEKSSHVGDKSWRTTCPGMLEFVEYPAALVKALCGMDVGCAFVYGVFCTLCFGAERMLHAGRLPIILLFAAMWCQRYGYYWGYVVLHSIWHALSAALMLEFLLSPTF